MRIGAARVGRGTAWQAGLPILALVVVPACSPPSPGEALWEISGATMGTSYSVKIVAEPDSEAERENVAGEVQAVLDAVDARMSTWKPDSELSRFNAATASEPYALSPELTEVLSQSLEISEASGGAFDVTVAPLVDAWGFGPTEAPPEPPEDDVLAELRERVGYRGLHLEDGAVTKARPDLRCDLSAIAKGWAVDRVADRLHELGHQSFMVEVGGEVYAVGRKEDGSQWRIAIERPRPGDGAVQRVVELDGMAIATSGDYRNYWERDGVRYSHTIDPRTGRPVAHSVVSASVLHESTAVADAWATAMMVLGPEEGPRVADAHGLAVLLVEHDGDSLREIASASFPDEDARLTP